jgi:hypothetical protein
MKYIKKFESNNYSEIKDNLEDLMYDFKDLGCEYLFMEDKGDDGILYTINLQIYPPNYSLSNYSSISIGNPYSDEYVGDQILDKSVSFLENQIQFNELFKDLLLRLSGEYKNKITFIGIKDKYYNICISAN